MAGGWPEAWRGPLAQPAFDGIRDLLAALDPATRPDLIRLNALAESRGATFRFVPPPAETLSAMRYEQGIAATGEIPTRDNWHDLFNALQWLAFPRMKAAINAGHVGRLAGEAEVADEARGRSVARDILTMADESGVLVASADESLLALLREFRWRELFVERRGDVERHMRFALVGHGLMEKMLAPFIGITGKALLLPAAPNESLDAVAAAWLADDAHLIDTHHLAPLPLLGIPGWDARNRAAAFYDDASYFRPGRRKRRT